MVQILPPGRQKQTFGQRLGRSVGEGLEKGQELYSKKQQSEALKTYGIDPNLSPELQKVALAESLKGQRQNDKFNRLSGLLNGSENEDSKQMKNENLSQGFNDDNFDQQEIRKITKKNAGPDEYPDELITQIAIEDPQLAKVLQHQKDVALREKREGDKQKRSQFESDRDYHSKRSDPIVSAAENVVREAPITKGISSQARRAVESGEVEGLVPFVLTKLGFDPAIPPDVATFMSAQKHAFLGDLKGLAAGARPNQFLEKLLSSALPAVGKPRDANLAILDMDDFMRDMKVKRAEIELNLADEDMKNHGYVKSDISRRATEKMNDYAENAQDKLAYTIRNRQVSSMSDDELAQEIAQAKVNPDQPLTQREARFIYLKNGGNMEAANKEIRKKGYKVLKKSAYASQ